MKINLFIWALFLIFAQFLMAEAKQESKVPAGTEKPEFHQSNEKSSCYVFSKYVVTTSVGGDSDMGGEDINIFKREGTLAAAKKLCGNARSKPYMVIKNPDVNYFYGLSGDRVFVDNGTSVESRGLEVFNLISKKSIYSTEYFEWINLNANRYVVFDKPSTVKGSLKTCPNAKKWMKEGGVGWIRRTQLDLETLKETPTGKLTCIYQQ